MTNPMEMGGSIEKEKGLVLAVIGNKDMTEGRGPEYIWVLTSNRDLAIDLARGNGPSGSNSRILPYEASDIPSDLTVYKTAQELPKEIWQKIRSRDSRQHLLEPTIETPAYKLPISHFMIPYEK